MIGSLGEDPAEERVLAFEDMSTETAKGKREGTERGWGVGGKEQNIQEL